MDWQISQPEIVVTSDFIESAQNITESVHVNTITTRLYQVSWFSWIYDIHTYGSRAIPDQDSLAVAARGLFYSVLTADLGAREFAWELSREIFSFPVTTRSIIPTSRDHRQKGVIE